MYVCKLGSYLRMDGGNLPILALAETYIMNMYFKYLYIYLSNTYIFFISSCLIRNPKKIENYLTQLP